MHRRVREPGANLGGLTILALLVGVASGIAICALVSVGPKTLQQPQQTPTVPATSPGAPGAAQIETVQIHILGLATVADQVARETGALPADHDALYAAWRAANPGAEDPLDPFDGQQYGYQADSGEFVIWSRGPDAASRDDDLYYSSAQAKASAAAAAAAK